MKRFEFLFTLLQESQNTLNNDTINIAKGKHQIPNTWSKMVKQATRLKNEKDGKRNKH